MTAMTFNEKGRFKWETFPDILELNGDLLKFIETDSLCGCIEVFKFNFNESFLKGNVPVSLGKVSSLCEIKELCDTSEYTLVLITKGYDCGEYLMYIADRLTAQERFLKESAIFQEKFLKESR